MLDNFGSAPFKERINWLRPIHRATGLALAIALCLLLLEPNNARAVGSQQSSLSVSFSDANVQAYNLETTATLAVASFDSSQSFPFTVNGVGSFTRAGTSSASWSSDSYYRAGNTGGYLFVQDITLTLASSSDYRYVGFYWSGGNADNNIQLLSENNTVLADFSADLPNTTEDVFGRTGACQSNLTDYCGSPNAGVNNDSDRFAFIHLRFDPGFRKVRFFGFNFEVDNITVSQTVPGVSSTETTTEAFQPYALTTPPVVIADPGDGSIDFPGVSLGAGSGETQAMICISQVASGGGALSQSPTITSSGSASGVTESTATNLRAYSGNRDTVQSFSSSIALIPVTQGQRFEIGSAYIRITVTPQANIGTAGCTGDNVDTEVVEVRFLRPYKSNSINIPID